MIWEYDQPKTSRGANPGFEVRSGQYQAKIKFAETHSEPFTTRIFHALGYNVDVTDYVSQIRMKYDRRVFLEFNLRHELHLDIRFFGMFTMGRVNMQSVHDPFDYLAGAELTDGSIVDRVELRKRLLRHAELEVAEWSPADFDPEFERKIEFLVTQPVNLQPKDPRATSVGPWAYDELGHADLREVRGVGLLAAWLGWFDTRFDNTRLRLVDGELRHYFSDLGGGLGRADAAFNWRAESINEFPWKFMAAPVVRGKGRMTTPFRVVHFHTVLDNPAFQAMTIEDARWMAGLIAQLSREQIIDALMASGYGAAETVLYAEKLIHRRNKMLRDIGGMEAVPPLVRLFDAQVFDYVPQEDPFWTPSRRQRFLVAEPMSKSVDDGRLLDGVPVHGAR